jgi:hypothetical protein
MKNKFNLTTFYGSPIPRLIAPVTGGLLLVLAVILGLVVLPPAESQAAGPDDAYIVIQFDKNKTIVRPISFTAPISGFKALELTGLNLITSSTAFGPAVCAIEGVGDSAANCFGAGFWAYSFWNGSAWESYPVGAGSSVVNDGTIELWAWSPGYVSPDAPGSGPQFVGAARALNWLRPRQSETNGGYGSAGNSIEVLMAIGADGYQGTTWQRQSGAPSLFGHVMATGAAYSTGGAAAASKLAVGLSAAGDCYPYGAALPQTYYITSTGIYTGGYGAGGAGPQSWSILGTRALSQTVPGQAVSYLKSIANGDGSWGWELGSSDTNGAALAIQALIAAGEPASSTAIVNGLNYLDAAQNTDGGFPYDPNSSFSTASDTNSTAYVVQALLAAGEDPLTGAWVISSTNPISYLLSMQLSDGSLEWQPGSGPNQLATQQAIPALLGRPFPVRLAEVAACQVKFLPLIYKK